MSALVSLFDAVAKNDAKTVEELITVTGSGLAELNSVNESGETPLHLAIKAKNLGTAELLLKHGANVNQPSEERGTTRGYTALHFAARNGDVDAIELLHKHQADMNRAAADGWTPLHTACFSGKSAAMRKLVGLGANPDAPNEHGMVPVVFAANHGRASDVRFLLSSGANPEFVDLQGDTLMHHALHFRLQEMFEGEYDMPEAQFDVVIALAIAGAPVDKMNLQGKVPCTYINETIPDLVNVLLILRHCRDKIVAAGGANLNYLSLLHAPVQALVGMGLEGKHAKDLFESMKKCEEQRLADKKRREEERPAGGCPVMKSKKSRSAPNNAPPSGHPPVDMSTIPEGTDPSNGQCPFFQRKAKQEANSAQHAPPADDHTAASAVANVESGDKSRSVDSVDNRRTLSNPSHPEPPAFTWSYLYENRTVLLMVALSFFIGSWCERRFGALYS